MQNNLQTQVRHMNTKHRNKRFWYRIVSALGCVVTFCTVYALILPAITLESANQTLACPLAVHQHSDACVNEGGDLICGEADYVVHTHDIYCYDADEVLVCALPVIETHTHTDECYSVSNELFCELEVHTHEDHCYEMPATGAAEATEGEMQSEEIIPVLVCAKSEHSHGEACYEAVRTLICEKNEIILHAHSEECYEEDALICGKIAVAEHTHEDICFVAVSDENEETESVPEATSESVGMTEDPSESVGMTEDPSETVKPTAAPTEEPTEEPTEAPTEEPTDATVAGVTNIGNSSGNDVILAASEDAIVVASGTCGSPNLDDVTWTLTDDGVLTISGTGAMANYDTFGKNVAPWSSNRSKITALVIESGITAIGKATFCYCNGLTNVALPDGVVTIGDTAFFDCNGLASVVLPTGVTTIGSSAFGSCEQLNRVNIPDSVTAIGSSAFSGCTKLASVSLPSGITTIADSMFSKCSILSSIEIPDSVTYIGNSAFSSCSELTELIIPENVTYIGNSAFSSCSQLTELIIPENVTYIGNSAFSGCSQLTSMVIPEGITDIGGSTFTRCTKLVSIVIPDSVTSIGAKAFSYCSSLTSVDIPDGVTSIGQEAFYYCTSLISIDIPDGVTSIGQETFYNCTSLTSIDIPDGVTSIGSGAFRNCTQLTSIVIPEGVTTIASNTFRSCTGLTSVIIPDHVTSIGDYAFSSCTKLVEITIGSNVMEIGANAFSSCTSLTNLVIPDTVVSIGSGAFSSCSRLTTLSIGSGVTDIAGRFDSCTSLTSIDISEDNSVYASVDGAVYTKDMKTLVLCPAGKTGTYTIAEGTTVIGEGAFKGCTSLTEVVIPDSVTTVGRSAFSNCRKLTDVTIPNSVTVIGDSAFSECTNLSTIVLPDGITAIENSVFNKCSKLTSVVIPDNVTSIGDSAFYNSGLTSIELPDSLISIGDSAFYNSGLTSIELPDSLISIGDYAFRYTDLKRIRIPASVTSISSNSFLECRSMTFFEVDEANEAYCSVDGVLFTKDMTTLLFYPAKKTDSLYVFPDTVTNLGNFAFNSCPYLLRIELPAGLTSCHSGFSSLSSLTNITLQNGTIKFSDSFRYFDKLNRITIGTKVDDLTYDPLSKIAYTRSTTLIFDGPNYFSYSGNDFSAKNLTMTASDYYVDEHGVLYRLNADGTATLVRVPETLALSEYDILSVIPSETGEIEFTVTAIGTYAFRNCVSLTDVTIPENVTELGGFAFMDCSNLERINGISEFGKVMDTWAKAGADTSTFLGTILWEQGVSSVVNITTDILSAYDDTDRKVTLSTGSFEALTGEALQTTLTIDQGEADSHSVVRVYFQFESTEASINYAVGSYTFDDVAVKVCQAANPNTYYVEVSPLLAGQTFSLSMTSIYKNIVSGGGTALVWMEVLPEAKAEAMGNSVTTPQNAHLLTWTTKPDPFPITKKAESSVAKIIGEGSEDGLVSVSGLKYSISMTRSGNTSSYGKDYMTSVDFVDTLGLPEGFSWREEFVDAIRAGNWYVVTESITSSSNDYQCFYVTVDDIAYRIAYIYTYSTSYFSNPLLSVDEAGNIQIGWTHRNTSSMNPVTTSSTEITNHSSTLTFEPYVIIADTEKIGEHIAESGTTVNYSFDNTVTAQQHFLYTDDQYQEASASKAISIGASDYTISKSAEYSTYSNLYLGSSNRFTISLSNTSALPYTELARVTDPLPTEYYIPGENMESMFYDDPYGKYLSINITAATLCQSVSSTVTGTDGKEYTISQQYQGIDVPYEGLELKDSSVVTSNASISFSWSEDRTYLIMTVSNSDTTSYSIGAGKDFSSIQSALDHIGYVITAGTQYTCTWDQTGQTLYGGEMREFLIRSVLKDSFMLLTGDQWWYYKNGYIGYRYNYAYSYSTNEAYKRASMENYLSSDFTLYKGALLNGSSIDDETPIQPGDVLTYRIDISHRGTGSYEALPLVDNMEGGQVLIVSADNNPSLADSGLETTEINGDICYLVNKVGTYESIMVGNYLADRVEVATTETGEISTLIYWYLTDINGTVNPIVEYQSLVSPEKAGTALKGHSYILKNEVWLNDHQTHRLYDQAFHDGYVLDIDKFIVTNIDENERADLSEHDYSKDELSERTIISEGEQVTYRLSLRTIGSGATTIHGGSMYDALPVNLNEHWDADNINVFYIPAEGSAVSVTNGDAWYIDTDAEDSTQQYLRWKDDFSVTLEGKLYIYVTLTFPTGAAWEKYCHAYGAQDVFNTFNVYQMKDSVSHLLSVTANTLLQKGVYLTGIAYSSGVSGYDNYRVKTEENSLWYYTNNSQGAGMITYYISLYNSGDSRVYISDIQDVLPEGFSYCSLFYSNDRIYTPTATSRPTSNTWSYNLISIPDHSVTYKRAYIEVSTADIAENQQAVTFSFSNSGSTGDLSYDPDFGRYYLKPGEALVFAFNCATNGYADTQDEACNIAAMPYFDYNGAGIHLDTQTVVDRKTTAERLSNNGNRHVMTNGQAELLGMDVSETDNSIQWLGSDVTVYRGEIMPGITKSASAPFANVADPVTWNVQISNSGTDMMWDYVITDTMMAPYQFQGAVGYRVYHNAWTSNYVYNDNLFTFGNRTPGDQYVTITARGDSYHLPINGGYRRITVYVNGAPSNQSTFDIYVSLSRDSNGNETLSIRFPYDANALIGIPASGTATLTVRTKNFDAAYENTTYFNTAYITPSKEQPFDTEAVSQGNYTILNELDSVMSEANVAVSFGYATTSTKSVTELNEPDNTTNSISSINYIVLPDSTSHFRYDLTVNNTGGDYISKAMDLLVFIDNLPEIDDHTTFYSEIPRYSEFNVNFLDSLEDLDFIVSVDDRVLDKSQYRLEFSKETAFTAADWAGENTTKWVEAPSQGLSPMRSFRVIIKDDSGTVIPADAKITVSFNAAIDLSQGAPEAAAVAWNSFGYHYSLIDQLAELEAAPQKVGVKIPSVPLLVKELKGSNGKVCYANSDETFRFVIYEGNAISVPDNCTEDEFFSTLGDNHFTVVELTVKQGNSTSDPISLENLYCYSYVDGTLSPSQEPWIWKNLTRYTLWELPSTSDSDYYFGSFNKTQPNNYTFSYISSSTRTLTCTNLRDVWSIRLDKLCQATQAPLSGAIFGIYSPRAEDLIANDDLIPLTTDLQNTPETNITIAEATWYLMDIKSTNSNGIIEWDNLTEENYYILELQAPSGYYLNAEPGQVVSKDINTIVITNEAGYSLPSTGGLGVTLYHIVGAALMGSILIVSCSSKRRKTKFSH